MTPRPWIVHVITRLDLGGAQQNTLDTCRLLDRGRYRVALLAGPHGYLDPDAARIPDLDFRIVKDLVREVRPRRDLAAFRQIRDHLRQFQSDGAPVIVHTHSSKAGILGRLAARAAGIASAGRVVHTVHGFGHPAFRTMPARALAVALERHVAGMTTCFVVVSDANRREGERLGLFAGKRVERVRSGFDLAAFRPAPGARAAARAALGIPPDAPLVGTVACLKPQKAPEDFLRTARKVVDRLPLTRFVIAGDGESRAKVEELRRELRLEKVVSLLGWRDDVPALLPAFDVFLLTSRWEGLPRAVVQAMTARVPVVATAADGTTDVVRNGETGLLADVGDTTRLARHVVDLLETREERERLAAAAAERVEPFDVRHMIEALERLYDELLESRPA